MRASVGQQRLSGSASALMYYHYE